MNDTRTETLIIGAGPAGLAAAACLSRRGLPLTLIEGAGQIGEAWHNHYKRLRLHTARDYSALPGLPFPVHYPTFPSREQVIEYLDSYAAKFELNPVLGQSVTRLALDDGTWTAETPDHRFRARRVIVATGMNRVPFQPEWPEQARFGGQVLHSRAYRDGAPFAGKRALVVGFGNTGAEIAMDLVEHGAAEVSVSIRGPVDVIPREFRGRPTQVRWNGRRVCVGAA